MAQTSRLVLEIDSRDAEQKAADVRKALGALEDAGLKVKPAMDKAGDGLDGLSTSSEKAKKSVHEQREEIDALLGSINPLTRKLNELEKQELALAKAHKSGKIETDTYKEYQAELTKTRNALTGVGVDMGKAGMSAKQMAANLRGVPAQFTDIAVSLQSGQAPLTVLLQQGGQLKDMFGGIGPAAKALGGYIVGLINPLTVGAAAAGVLAAIFYDAEKQVSAFNKALFSGTASSGQTASSLAAISGTVSSLTGDISEANAAVIALAGSAKLSQTQFINLAQASASIAEFSGKSAADVAKSLGDVGGSATKAAEKISAQYGLLTSAQYEVIAALDDQGKKQEALDALSGFLNENALKRLTAYKASLSDIERDWNNIGTAISNAYSKVKAELFPDLAKQAEIIERILKTRADGGVSGAISTGLSKLNTALGLADGSNDDSTEALQRQLAAIRERLSLSRQSAVVDGEAGKAEQARIEAIGKWDALHKKNLFDQAKLEDDIKEARKLGLSAGRSQIEIDKEVASIQAKYDKSQAKPKAYTEDAGMKTLDNARQQLAVLQQQNALIGAQKGDVEKLGTAGQALVKWEQQLADIKGKQTLTADQKSLVANQELITAQLKRNAGLEKEIELRKTATEEISKLSAFQANQSSRLSTAQDGLNSSIEGIGLGSKARDRLKQDLAIQKDYARQSADLLEQRNTDRISPDLYAKENTIVQEGLAKRLAMQQDYYNQQDAAQDDWLAGASSAWQNYFEIATDYNQQTQDATANLLGDTTSSLSGQIQNLTNGTITLGTAFSNLGTTMADSVLGALSDIAAQWVVTQALKMAGITAETTAVVASEGVKTTAKVTGDAVATGSTLASLATTTAASVASAATTMASWLPTALVASIGTFGAAAVVGGAGLLAAFALIKGFSDGGYTGAGGVNEPAGMVHKGEVVWSQADIRRSGGVSAVESLRKGNVSPMAGSTASSSLSVSGAAQTGSAPAAPPITQQFSFQGTPDDATISLVKDAAYQGAKGGYEMVMRDLKQNGPIRQLIRR